MSDNKLNTVSIDNTVVLGRNTFVPPYSAQAELKDEARIVFIVKGTNTVSFPDGKQTFRTGDVFVMKCDRFTSAWHENEDGSESVVIVMMLTPETLHKIYEGKPPLAFQNSEPIQTKASELIEPSDMLSIFTNSLCNYLDNPVLLNNEMAIIKIRELITIMLRSDQNGGIKTIFSDLFKTNNYEFREIIKSHIYDNINLDDLAFLTGLSLSSFKRKFKSIYADSPKHYINKIRLEKAAALLANSELRISEIAYECGFNDVAYFTKAFGNTYQISPSEYRKSV